MYPPLQSLPHFVEALTTKLRIRGVAESDPLLFFCRSGARSRAAAIAMSAAGWKSSYNIADGFEGPLDSARHRGAASGWKAGEAAMDTDLRDV
jgi:rhodanese-related sulfurtransferase